MNILRLYARIYLPGGEEGLGVTVTTRTNTLVTVLVTVKGTLEVEISVKIQAREGVLNNMATGSWEWVFN